MPRSIKSRVYDVNKQLSDLIPELEKLGIYICNQSEISMMMKGTRKGPKTVQVLSACDKIVTKWEKELRRKERKLSNVQKAEN